MQDLQTESSTVADTVAALKGVPTREELLEMLSKDLLGVVFTKLNGDERKMMCTLKPAYLPESDRDDKLSQKKIRNLEESVIVVWDVESKGWRSFRYDRLKSVEQITPVDGK